MKNLNLITLTKNKNLYVVDNMGFNIIILDDSGY